LGKADSFFDFGDKGSLGVVKGHGVYLSFLLEASLMICLVSVIYIFEGTGIRNPSSNIFF
jgi:hypothetical protein